MNPAAQQLGRITTWTHSAPDGSDRTVLAETARETSGGAERVRVRYLYPVESEPVFGWQPVEWMRKQGWVEGVTP